MLQEHYPNRLCFLRRRNHLSQKQVAILLGQRDRTMISKYERGHVQPQFSVAAKCQILFGARMEDIFPEEFKRFQREVDLVKANRLKSSAGRIGENI
jgi:transcriptional regulator with XRE-family HTH domain